MISSYYLWKWADNDLPGKPNQVFSALLQGKLHPALQPFDAQPLTGRLGMFADCRRKLDEEWNWQVHPADNPANARFVFLTGPHLHDTKERAISFSNAMNGLETSGYDEQYGHIIHLLQPKLNCLLFGQDHRERCYDITPEELPPLLRRIDHQAHDPFVVLENRRHHFVQCYAEQRRFCVEWRENYDTIHWKDFMHWRASAPSRPEAKPPGNSSISRKQPDPDLMTFADTVQIFQAFLRGEPKPHRYRWREIRADLEREEANRKKRKRSK